MSRDDAENGRRTFYVGLGVAVITTALLLSWIWRVPYIFTLIGFSAWAFFGHLVTADDDVRGGWSNPDGTRPFPWGELVIKGAIFAFLCVITALVRFIRGLGGSP